MYNAQDGSANVYQARLQNPTACRPAFRLVPVGFYCSKNDKRLEPEGTASQPAVGFEVTPKPSNLKVLPEG